MTDSDTVPPKPKVVRPADGRPGRVRRLTGLAVAAAVTAALAVGFFATSRRPASYSLRLSAGSERGHRHEIATALAGGAASGLTIDVTPTGGSFDVLDRLADGELDIGLVQGGLARGAGAEGLRHVASLVAEPLHLLVPADRAEKDFSSLFRGRRVNLSTPSSGTRRLAEQVLEFAAIDAATYEAGDLGYEAVAGQLATADEAFAGPEVLFAVESLPGRFADLLVTEHGFTPVSIPFAEAVCLRDRSLEVVTIPAGTYRAWNPSVPAGPVVTVAPRLTLLARDDVPAEAVERLLAVLYEGDVRLDAELPRIDASDLDAGRELPLHDGASAYLRRNEPLFTTGLVDSIESARSFAFSALVAGFLIWRWTARRRAVRLEEYFDEISDIERRAFARLGRGEWDAAARDDYLDRLTTLKATAIEAYSSGRIDGHDQFNGFLQHVADARATVRSLGRG